MAERDLQPASPAFTLPAAFRKSLRRGRSVRRDFLFPGTTCWHCAVVNAAIQQLLARISKDHGIHICYACESGSRAWGFASPDSDYDIRFLFSRSPQSYTGIDAGMESIDLPLEGELDAGGWDIRKGIRHLRTSNGAMVEWLHSPVIYHAEPGFLERWQSAAREWFSPNASHSHYRGLATGMIRGRLQGQEVRAKDCLYALRASLAARWVAQGRGIPPVAFSGLLPLLPSSLEEPVNRLLEWKSRSAEAELMPRDEALDHYFQEFLSEQVSLPRTPSVTAAADRFFRTEVLLSRPLLQRRDLTLERVRQPDLLLLDTVAGSHAYGTAIEGSDRDRRGIFLKPLSFLYGLEDVEQVSDARSDEVCYEAAHFISLLQRNNPNALELLAMPEDCILYRHPAFSLLQPEIFLSRLCARTFGEYSMGQIRKARGLNKKIVNPQPQERLPMLSFCHVPEGQGSVPVLDWLAARGIQPHECGVTAVQHAAGLFALYHGESGCRGLVSPRDADALVFTSVPKNAEPVAWMHYNQDAFRAHCKAHREYWAWVENRNQERYATNVAHDRGYDSKNLMHTHRLLDMAGEIAAGRGLIVRRPNREELLAIRSGLHSYEDLVSRAEEKLHAMEEAFLRSDLPDAPDPDRIRELVIRLRASFD